MTPESRNLHMLCVGLRWSGFRGNKKGAAAGRRIVETRLHSNKYD
jgi:hypothetical protein